MKITPPTTFKGWALWAAIAIIAGAAVFVLVGAASAGGYEHQCEPAPEPEKPGKAEPQREHQSCEWDRCPALFNPALVVRE